MQFIKWLLAIVFVLGAGLFLGRAVFPLPSTEGRARESAMTPAEDSDFARLIVSENAAYPDRSGIVPLAAGRDAIASRLFLAAAATRSIDAQYYIWHDDTTGRLLLKALYDAAERGVRVRLLLDDNGIHGLDPTIAALETLPNVDIRIFNPSTVRRPKMLGYALDFFRMNRRMHNKAFIVDGIAAIIGGRNIGDEYFGVGERTFFLDLDVLALGTVVPEVSKAFDLYWNSASAIASTEIVDPSTGSLEAFLDGAKEAAERPDAAAFLQMEGSGASNLVEHDVNPEWVAVKLVVDDPVKGLGAATRDQLMITRLMSLLGKVGSSLDLVSAYFVPGAVGTKFFTDLAAGGAKVRILTNAMQTTDVAVVHSGYSKYREALLEGGVELFELKPIAGAPRGDEELGFTGSSGASLHAKTFAVDRDRIFIGSFNFDPRSALLNCEMGFLIESPTLARTLSDSFDTVLPFASYEPRLENGEIAWLEQKTGAQPVRYKSEPGVGWGNRLMLAVFSVLPVEWLL